MAVLETFTVENEQFDLKDHATRTANRVMISDSNGLLAASSIDPSDVAMLSDIPVIPPIPTVPAVTVSTTDITAGSTALTTGDFYLVYE